jgi:hypothetical protein
MFWTRWSITRATLQFAATTPTAAVIPIMYLPYALSWVSSLRHAYRT